MSGQSRRARHSLQDTAGRYRTAPYSIFFSLSPIAFLPNSPIVSVDRHRPGYKKPLRSELVLPPALKVNPWASTVGRLGRVHILVEVCRFKTCEHITEASWQREDDVETAGRMWR